MRQLDRLSLENPAYGSRKLLVMLERQGVSVNRKRVVRLMGLMGIEAIHPRVKTSQPGPNHRIYPYLLKGLEGGPMGSVPYFLHFDQFNRHPTRQRVATSPWHALPIHPRPTRTQPPAHLRLASASRSDYGDRIRPDLPVERLLQEGSGAGT
jgi:hypothetical protein